MGKSKLPLKDGKMTDILGAQSVFESGSKLLKHCSHIIEALHKELTILIIISQASLPTNSLLIVLNIMN